jgi:esterase/lipase superfamily enzyme
MAMSRAAQVAAAYRAKKIFCFSWPTKGVVTARDYFRDRGTAEQSALAIARSLARLFAALPARRTEMLSLNLVAHSMGNFALSNAIQTIRSIRRQLVGGWAFERAFLMGADEDDNALSRRTKLKPLLDLAREIHVYTNGGDVALSVSRLLLDHLRLGQNGPRQLGNLPESVTWIDCSEVSRTRGDSGESHWGHQYYRLSDPVINDVRQVLTGVPPRKVRPRLKNFDSKAEGRAFIIPFDPNAGSFRFD